MHEEEQRQEGRHRVERVAAGLRRAAQAAGVQLTVRYSRRLATDGLASVEQLGVTHLGNGVVIHTASVAPIASLWSSATPTGRVSGAPTVGGSSKPSRPQGTFRRLVEPRGVDG